MVTWQKYSTRKSSGGKRHVAHKKRKRELGRHPIETKVGPRSVRKQRVRGGGKKYKLYKDELINVSLGDGTTKQVKIKEVLKNVSSKDYDRRKIITRGTLVKTELGTVKVTSRPGQVPQINGVLVEDS